MRLFGNAVQNLYAALSITAPSGYVALTLSGSSGQSALSVFGNSAFTGNVGIVSQASGQALAVNNNANTLQYLYVNATGGVVIGNPGTNYGLSVTGGASLPALYAQAGTGQLALSVSGVSGQYSAQVSGVTTSGVSYGLSILAGTNSSDTSFNVNNAASTAQYFNIRGDGSVAIGGATQNGPGCLSILKSLTAASTGQAVQHSLLSSYQLTPGTGAFLSNAYLYVGGSGGNYLAFGQNPATAGDPYAQWIQSGFSSTSSVYYSIALNPAGGNVTIGSSSTSSGLLLNGNPIYAGIPVNVQSANYTTVLGDANKCIQNTNNVTIAANSSVAYPIGTAITFVNSGGSAISIAINSDTMYLSPGGSTGTRTLATYGIATALKTGSTTWRISGTGLS